MIALPILLLVIGVFLSAFFSGMETGFYRASRVRVVMAGLEGDRISQSLLKLINNPTWFVATALIGNNVANYLTSLSLVLLTAAISQSSLAEMVVPIATSPLLFVYGELLPKNLFYQAPNFLLRLGAPLFLFFSAVFAPAAFVLWSVGQLMERLLGQSPDRIRMALARAELQQVLEDGYEAGILLPTQRQLAQSFFVNASESVRNFCTPVARVRSVPANSSVEHVLKFASKHKLADIPLTGGKRRQLTGYVRTVDLLLSGEKQKPISHIRPLVEIGGQELFGEVVLRMQADRETLAKVIGKDGQLVGLLSLDALTNSLLDGPLASLKR